MSSRRGSSGKAVLPIDGCGSGGEVAWGRDGPMPTARPLPVVVVEDGETRETVEEVDSDGDSVGVCGDGEL